MQNEELKDYEENVEGVVVDRSNNDNYEDLQNDVPMEDNVAPMEDEASVDTSETQPLVEGEMATEEYNEPEAQPQMFTQEQVNELVGRIRMETREKTLRQLLDKYGVENDGDLDGIFGKGQSFDVLNGQYGELNTKYENALADNALLRSGIDESRYEDAMLILRGKGLPITLENIQNELITHPEWKSNGIGANQQMATPTPITESGLQEIVNTPTIESEPKPATTIRRMGTNIPTNTEPDNEKEMILGKYFGL